MKLTVNQFNLKSALGIVGRAVSTRSTHPVLANILITTDGADRLKLSATNRQLTISCWIGAKVEDNGAITIPARLLAEFVNNMPADEFIDFHLTEHTQTIAMNCKKFKANIKGIAASEFPLIESITDDVSTEFGDELNSMIDLVTFAALTDESRPTLTGVNLTADEHTFTMAATDGYRLSVVNCDTLAKFSAIIPASSLNEIARTASDASSVTMSIDNKASFVIEGTEKTAWQRIEVISELIDAKYPDYTGTIPNSCDTQVRIGVGELFNAVNVALLFARDNANIIRFHAHAEGLRISATSAELGDSVNEITAQVDGNDIEISFNGAMLKEALQHFSGDIIIELTKSTRPALMYVPGQRDTFYHVIMPMHPPR